MCCIAYAGRVLAMNSRPLTPPAGSVERWAYNYVTSDSLAHKFSPGDPGGQWLDCGTPCVLEAPGRPQELTVVNRADKTPGPDALRDPARRARLLHTFLHHELQAAELMCHAVLVFPQAPKAFRRGLINICLDEVRHMNMYAEHMADLGFQYGDFPINDWFWQRVPSAHDPLSFVAVMSLGFEGANLDHTQRFAERFVRAGDDKGARLQQQVGEEEVPHVAFGAHWFSKLRGRLDFESWLDALPAPLSPILMRGKPLHAEARLRAGMSENFLNCLQTWQPHEHSP